MISLESLQRVLIEGEQSGKADYSLDQIIEQLDAEDRLVQD